LSFHNTKFMETKNYLNLLNELRLYIYNSVQITGLTSQILAQHGMNQSCGPQEEQERIRVLLPGFMFPLGFYNGVSALLLLKCVFMMLLFFDSIYFRQGTDRADRG
jgi:hypothetical protein